MNVRIGTVILGIVRVMSTARAAVLTQETKPQEARPVTETCTLSVEGMACGACENRVQKVAKKIAGVSDVIVDYKAGTAQVTYDPMRTTPTEVAKAITDNASFKSAVTN